MPLVTTWRELDVKLSKQTNHDKQTTQHTESKVFFVYITSTSNIACWPLIASLLHPPSTSILSTNSCLYLIQQLE